MADPFCATCATNECTGQHREGRNCLAALNATRAIFWLEPLNYLDADGGRKVSGEDSQRLDSDRCTVCFGQCPVPEACNLPVAREPAPNFRIPLKAWAFIGAVSGALAAAWVIARFPV